MARARQKGSKDGKGKGKGKRGKERQGAETRKARSRDTADTSKKWRHKCADCRKRVADGKSKCGAAAASVDTDGEVQAVMQSDDEEASLGWCFAVTSLCATVGSTGSFLFDSGIDGTLVYPKFADVIPASPDRSPLKLKDVQQKDLAIKGQKTVPVMVGPTGGQQSMEATATFRVAEVRDNVLSLGKLVRKGFNFVLFPRGCIMEKDGRSVPLFLEWNSLRVEARVFAASDETGCVAAGTAVAYDNMAVVGDQEPQASSSS